MSWPWLSYFLIRPELIPLRLFGGPSSPRQNCHFCIFQSKGISNLRICIQYLGHHCKTKCQESAKSMRYHCHAKVVILQKIILQHSPHEHVCLQGGPIYYCYYYYYFYYYLVVFCRHALSSCVAWRSAINIFKIGHLDQSEREVSLPQPLIEKRDFGPIRNKSGEYGDNALLENPHSTFSIAILNVSLLFYLE